MTCDACGRDMYQDAEREWRCEGCDGAMGDCSCDPMDDEL